MLLVVELLSTWILEQSECLCVGRTVRQQLYSTSFFANSGFSFDLATTVLILTGKYTN